MHQRKLGIVMAPPENRAASHWPATTAAKMPASAPIAPTVVIGRPARLRRRRWRLLRCLRAQLVAADEVLRHRPGNDAADDQAEVATVIDSSITVCRLFTSAKRSA